MMDPKVVFNEEKTVVGRSIRTTNEGGQSAQEQPQLWQEFFSENFLSHVQNLSNPGVVLGVYTEYEKDETKPYTYLVGAETSEKSEIPDGLSRVQIPASRYAVFTSIQGPVGQVVSETWQQIWNWSKQSEYRRTFKGDFEVYNMAADPAKTIVQIYIGIE